MISVDAPENWGFACGLFYRWTLEYNSPTFPGELVFQWHLSAERIRLSNALFPGDNDNIGSKTALGS